MPGVGRTSPTRTGSDRRSRRKSLQTTSALPTPAPTRSSRRSSPRDPRRSARCTSSRCRTPVVASRRRPATSHAVREICDRHGVLLVSDEVICGFGRLGSMFAADRYGYLPDMITFAKGVTSGYAPLGGVIARDTLGRTVPVGHGQLRSRHHVRRPSGQLRDRAREPRRVRTRRNHRARPGERRPSSGDAWSRCATSPSSATYAATATSSPSSS